MTKHPHNLLFRKPLLFHSISPVILDATDVEDVLAIAGNARISADAVAVRILFDLDPAGSRLGPAQPVVPVVLDGGLDALGKPPVQVPAQHEVLAAGSGCHQVAIIGKESLG